MFDRYEWIRAADSPVNILIEFAIPICKPLIYLKNFADRLAVFIYSVTPVFFWISSSSS